MNGLLILVTGTVLTEKIVNPLSVRIVVFYEEYCSVKYDRQEGGYLATYFAFVKSKIYKMLRNCDIQGCSA